VKQRGGRREELLSTARHLGLSLPDEAIEKLIAYEGLLRERAVPLGFIARSDEDRLWSRHILDSLRAAAAVRPGDASAIDLGSGAGLPGVVLAIATPRVHVSLVEIQRRRVAFLELVVERLQLANAEVLGRRAETLDRPQADICTARAFAPPSRAWEVASRLLAPEGRLIYFSGAGTFVQAPPNARIVALPPGIS
jgi:16S rRNA (guanine527-N7)-methyltransferase